LRIVFAFAVTCLNSFNEAYSTRRGTQWQLFIVYPWHLPERVVNGHLTQPSTMRRCSYSGLILPEDHAIYGMGRSFRTLSMEGLMPDDEESFAFDPVAFV
jgi:hypothetical protein